MLKKIVEVRNGDKTEKKHILKNDRMMTLPSGSVLAIVLILRNMKTYTTNSEVVYMTVHFLTGLNFCPSDKSLLWESLYTSGLA